MHAYEPPPPRSLARSATVLHALRNASPARVGLRVEEWRPGAGAAALDSLEADLRPGDTCTFVACAGADLVLTLHWDGATAPCRHRFVPPGSWLPGSGLRSAPLREVLERLPAQWTLGTELLGFAPADVLRGLGATLGDALRAAGFLEHAAAWEERHPEDDGAPCTVFAVADGSVALRAPAALEVPGHALFFDAPGLQGAEPTAAGGHCRYRTEGLSVVVALRGGGLGLDLVGDLRQRPLRTRNRHQLVHVLQDATSSQ